MTISQSLLARKVSTALLISVLLVSASVRTVRVSYGYLDVYIVTGWSPNTFSRVCWHLVDNQVARFRFGCMGLTGCSASDLRGVGKYFDVQSLIRT